MRDDRDQEIENLWRQSHDGHSNCPSAESVHQMVLGTLEKSESLAFASHLESCSACAAEFELAKLFETPAEPVEQADVDFIVARLKNAEATRTATTASAAPWEKLGRFAFGPGLPRRAMQMAVAAMLLLVVGVTVRTWIQSPPPLKSPPAEGVARGAVIQPLSPIGEIDEMPQELSWEFAEGASFDVVLSRIDGSVVWKARVVGNEAVIPDEVSTGLHDAVVYSWSVEALDAKGVRLAWSGPVEWRVRPRR